MTDLIARLRDTNRPDAMLMSYRLRLEAADEIERLRAAHKGVQFRTLVDQRHEAANEIERLRAERDRMIEAMERIGKQSPEHRLLVQRVWREVNQ